MIFLRVLSERQSCIACDFLIFLALRCVALVWVCFGLGFGSRSLATALGVG